MSTHLPAAAVRRIEQNCDRFETAWKTGHRPDPAEYLGASVGAERSGLLRELLLLDCEYRLRSGETPRAADYAGRFPGDATIVADVISEVAVGSDGKGAASSADGSDTAWNTAGTQDLPADAGAIGVRYDLGQEVGRGGIGVVYRGRDRRLGRDLAVKVLRDAYRDRRDAHRRFLAEARVGSQLQHPGIVPVYELGRSSDRGPFITMKLVEGHTLAALLRERPDPGHDLPRFLGVFVQVCQAMAYAHDRGVVHRDLKPHNVMVGNFGEVQVMDWGLAKILAGEEVATPDGAARPDGGTAALSHTGGLMGTPAYMPPEQARGESALIDPRADVFALGAILCEILTGQPPYTGESADELCRRAAAGSLDGAFARLDACGADAAIRELARQCLAADREVRPADARAVARDVTEYLASVQDRLRRAELERAAAEVRVAGERRARRLTVALAAALLVGAGAATWQAVVATRARRDALAAAEAETEAKRNAQAKAAETAAVFGFVERHILAAARPKGRGGLGSDVTLRAAITAALPSVDSAFKDQPLTEARLRKILGDSFDYLGDARAAVTQYEPARTIYERLLGPDDLKTLDVTNRLAVSYGLQNRHQESVDLWEPLLPRCHARYGSDDPFTLDCMHNLALGYYHLRRYDEAEVRLKAVLAVKKQKLAEGDRSTLLTMTGLANVYQQQGRHDEAIALRLETWQAQKDHLGEAKYDTLTTAHNIGAHYRSLGRFAEALRHDQDTLRLRARTLDRGHPETIQSHCCVAEDLIGLGRASDAVPHLDECLRLGKGQYVHPYFARVADLRLRVFEKAGDAAGCRATAELWEGQGRTDAISFYAAARFRAVTAGVFRATVPAATWEAEAEADRAIAWLRQARAAGYKDVAGLKKDKDFAVLHDRADFQKLVSE